jgi:hypothetical protein
VSIIVWLSHLWVLLSEKLNRLYTPRMIHGSQNDALERALQIRGDAGFYDGVASLGL